MSLPARVAIILVLIRAATVGLTTVLAANKFKQGLGELLDVRYRLVISDIVATIDTSLGLRHPSGARRGGPGGRLRLCPGTSPKVPSGPCPDPG